MTNNKDLNYVEQLKAQLNIPKTETRIILEQKDLYPDLTIKKSKLSPAARNKVVNDGSYVSERITDLVPSYGPCSTSDCLHSTSFKVHIEVPTRSSFSGSHRFIFERGESIYFTSFTCDNVGQAERALRDFESGNWKVSFEGYLYTSEGGTLTNQKNAIVRRVLKDAIRDHRDYGNRIDIERQLKRGSESA